MAADPGKYDAIIGALGANTAAPVSSGPLGGLNIIDVGNDNGRGPGTPGGRGTGNAGMQASGRGVGGQGYTEEDINLILRGMPPEKIAIIQQQMQVSGLLPDSFRTFGFVDDTTRRAFAEVLDMSNGRGASYATTLDSLEIGGKAALDEARREKARQSMASYIPNPRIYTSTDPEAVRQTAEAAFRQNLGRKPKPEELDRFVKTWQSMEISEQGQTFDAQESADRYKFNATQAAQMEAEGTPAVGGEGGSESDILWERLQKMIADSPYKIGLGSRSRSYEEQVRLYNEYKSGRGPLAAKPGTSKHGDGRANDLKYSSDKARQWVLANAERYGLHLPLYDPSKPRSKDESWHVELKGGHTVNDGHNHGGGAPAGGAAPSFSVQRADLGAQAVEYARTVNPDETAAYDIGQQFNSMLAILSKGVV